MSAARAALGRLGDHIRGLAETGDPDPALGGPLLARLMGSIEAVPVDLGRLAERADAERDRLRGWLVDACARLQPRAASSVLRTRSASPSSKASALTWLAVNGRSPSCGHAASSNAS